MLCFRKVREAVTLSVAGDALLPHVKMVSNLLYPGGKLKSPAPIRTAEEKLQTRDSAYQKLAFLLPDVAASVIGRSNARRGARRLFAVLQNKRLTQHLIYTLLDDVSSSSSRMAQDVTHDHLHRSGQTCRSAGTRLTLSLCVFVWVPFARDILAFLRLSVRYSWRYLVSRSCRPIGALQKIQVSTMRSRIIQGLAFVLYGFCARVEPNTYIHTHDARLARLIPLLKLVNMSCQQAVHVLRMYDSSMQSLVVQVRRISALGNCNSLTSHDCVDA